MTRKKTEKKDYKWPVLISSIVIIFTGITILIITPLLNIWGFEIKDLKILKESFPSGYVICAIGLLFELIAYLPEIILAIRKK